MATSWVQFNPKFFDRILKTSGVRSLTKAAAQRVLAQAKASAPVDTGEYKSRLEIEEHDAKYRTVYRVVGNDRKTLLIEARTGNLARALKRVARG